MVDVVPYVCIQGSKRAGVHRPLFDVLAERPLFATTIHAYLDHGS